MGALAFPFTIDATGGVAFSRERHREAMDRVINCLTTNPRERVLRPAFGGGVRAALFEPLDALTVEDIRDQVSRALASDVPSVNVVKVEVSQDAESRIIVSVFFSLSEDIDGRVYVATVTDGVTTEESL